MRVFVRCDRNGTILSVTKVRTMSEGMPHPYGPMAEEDERIVEIEADAAAAQLDAHEVVERYVVDPSSGTLRKLAREESRGAVSAAEAPAALDEAKAEPGAGESPRPPRSARPPRAKTKKGKPK